MKFDVLAKFSSFEVLVECFNGKVVASIGDVSPPATQLRPAKTEAGSLSPVILNKSVLSG